ncbi:MAG: hypothetical protein U9Q61_08980, partial [Thermodesulfobacteriota bacterium]|nr:hypothetical protein [Thermodesulfobacteriota bacterium]
KVAGLRPRTPPYSFVAPQKSKQKRAPELLALRVPSVPFRFAAQKKTRYAQTFFFETLQSSTARRLRHTGLNFRFSLASVDDRIFFEQKTAKIFTKPRYHLTLADLWYQPD